MGGLALVIDRQCNGRVSQEKMTDLIRQINYRGPDGVNVWVDDEKNLGLANARFALIGGAGRENMQPLWNEKKEICVILNGDIFNYHELRHDLERKGHVFFSGVDAEVIVHCYEEYGFDFVRQIDGIFSVIVADFRYKQILLARDSLGKKPLYYHVNSDWFIAGSEMRLMLQGIPGPGGWLCDFAGLSDYLVFGHTVRQRTIVRGIQRVLPGEIILASMNGERIHSWKYWSMPAVNPYFNGDSDAAYQRFKVRFEASVSRRFEVSDRQVDLFLSGGVGSTAVACAAVELGYLPDTYTLGIGGAGRDESQDGEMVANGLGLKCNLKFFAGEAQPSKLLDVISHYDDPYSDLSSIAIDALSLFAAETGRRVALAGAGGDELEIDYHVYQQYMDDCSKGNGRWWIPFGDFLRPVTDPYELITNWAHLYPERFSLIPQHYRQLLLADSFDSINYETSELIRTTMMDQSTTTSYDFLSRFDYLFNMPESLLMRMDRIGMRRGLEIRSPLLDRDLVSFMSSLPERIRFGVGWEYKWMLRRYISEIGGNSEWCQHVLSRQKNVPMIPCENAISRIINFNGYQWLLENDFLWWTGLRRSGIEALLAKKTTKEGQRSIWHLICLYIWWKTYICNSSVDLKL